jgi:hypothetical protein
MHARERFEQQQCRQPDRSFVLGVTFDIDLSEVDGAHRMLDRDLAHEAAHLVRAQPTGCGGRATGHCHSVRNVHVNVDVYPSTTGSGQRNGAACRFLHRFVMQYVARDHGDTRVVGTLRVERRVGEIGQADLHHVMTVEAVVEELSNR